MAQHGADSHFASADYWSASALAAAEQPLDWCVEQCATRARVPRRMPRMACCMMDAAGHAAACASARPVRTPPGTRASPRSARCWRATCRSATCCCWSGPARRASTSSCTTGAGTHACGRAGPVVGRPRGRPAAPAHKLVLQHPTAPRSPRPHHAHTYPHTQWLPRADGCRFGAAAAGRVARAQRGGGARHQLPGCGRLKGALIQAPKLPRGSGEGGRPKREAAWRRMLATWHAL